MKRPIESLNSSAMHGDMTGMFSPDEQGLCETPVPIRRPLSLAWMSDELITETQRLWSARYEREISPDEAVEILQNVNVMATLHLDD